MALLVLPAMLTTAPHGFNKQIPDKVASPQDIINVADKTAKEDSQPEKRPPAQEIEMVEELPQVQLPEVAPIEEIQPPTPQPVAGCDQLRTLLVNYGLNSAEVEAAISIASRESGCRSTAQNASSGACNFFQELPCGKWGDLNNIMGHIAGADSYAKNRYGGWQGALSFWNANHWW